MGAAQGFMKININITEKRIYFHRIGNIIIRNDDYPHCG